MNKNKMIVACIASLLLIPASAFTGDNPRRTPAKSIRPLQDQLGVTELTQKASDGKETIKVDKRGLSLDPRQWILLRNESGSRQEIHCIKSIDQDKEEDFVTIKLSSDLHYSYPAGTQLIQGSVARERGIVGQLTRGRNPGSRELTMDTTAEIDLLEQVVLQDPSGGKREAHCVKWIEDGKLGLFDKTFEKYPKESVVIQGGLLQGVVEREDLPCGCSSKGDWKK